MKRRAVGFDLTVNRPGVDEVWRVVWSCPVITGVDVPVTSESYGRPTVLIRRIGKKRSNRRGDRCTAIHTHRTALAEIVLNIDDQKRTTHR
jgi:hypothetical protein